MQLNYFGNGWVRALLALCKWDQSLLGRGETGQSLVLVTAELQRMGARAPTQLVEEASRLQMQGRFEYALFKTHSMEDYPAELKHMLDGKWGELKKMFPGVDVRPGYYSYLHSLQLHAVPFSKLKQLLDTGKVHDHL